MEKVKPVKRMSNLSQKRMREHSCRRAEERVDIRVGSQQSHATESPLHEIPEQPLPVLVKDSCKSSERLSSGERL